MKSSLMRLSGHGVGFILSAAVVTAHPGHDGHELTWDLAHLAAYPGATAGAIGVLIVATGVVAWGRRSRARSRAQSLRGSAVSWGK